MNNSILIRPMTDSDAPIITAAEIAQGWSAEGRLEKYLQRLIDQREGRCVSLVAEYHGETAGYINIYFSLPSPEIVDFGVLEKFRRRGVGSALMDAAEEIAAERSNAVCLSVGLHSGYGNAQRIYVKRGYIPDGHGAYYADRPADPYRNYPLDDDLALRLIKTLHQ